MSQTEMSQTATSSGTSSQTTMSQTIKMAETHMNVREEWINLPPTTVRGRCSHGRLFCYTSWTKSNPGRRFWRCPTSKNDDCGAFRWFDGEVSYIDKLKYGVLLDKIKVLEDQALENVHTLADMNKQVERMVEIEEEKQQENNGLKLVMKELIEENDSLRVRNEETKKKFRLCKLLLISLICFNSLAVLMLMFGGSNDNELL